MSLLFSQYGQCLFIFLVCFFGVFIDPVTPKTKDTVFCDAVVPGGIQIKSDSYQDSANIAPHAYEYDPNFPNTKQIKQVTVDDIKTITQPDGTAVVNTIDPSQPLYNADHVFEAQTIKIFFQLLFLLQDPNDPTSDGHKICKAIGDSTLLQEQLQTVMNSVTNMRWLDDRINLTKGRMFGGFNVNKNPDRYFAVVDYLRKNDIYTAFAITRMLVTKYFCDVAKDVKAKIDMGLMFGLASGIQYVAYTGIPLPLPASCDGPQNQPRPAPFPEKETVKVPAKQAVKMVVPSLIFLPGSSVNIGSLASQVLKAIQIYAQKDIKAAQNFIASLPSDTINAIKNNKDQVIAYMMNHFLPDLVIALVTLGFAVLLATGAGEIIAIGGALFAAATTVLNLLFSGAPAPAPA